MNPLDVLALHWSAWIFEASWQLALLVVIVAVVCALCRRASPRLRHALWLLVLLKVVLPPSLITPISVGHWAIAPLLTASDMMPTVMVTERRIEMGDIEQMLESGEFHHNLERNVRAPRETLPIEFKGPVALMTAWLIGCPAFWLLVAGRYRSVRRLIDAAHAVDEGPARIILERLGLELKLGRQPDLLAGSQVGSPFLFGFLRPRIVVPETLLSQGNETVLEAVLAHELAHFQRHDAWIGWLQVAAQSLFWFHPFVWWANRQLRHERECASDEAVLQLAHLSPQHYGEAILNLLIASRGKTLVAGSLVGVFEPGGKLERRLEEIMKFEPSGRQFRWLMRLALLAFAILFLPMNPGEHVIQADDDKSVPILRPATSEIPQIVKTNPERGDIEVDPGQREISVTFDRDMGKGMSWTGGPPLFPEVDGDLPVRWIDERTCVLPVKLKKGTYYRVGINASGFHNFQSRSGHSVNPTVIAFVTKGADKATKQRVKAPRIVTLKPDDAAVDVDPSTKSLTVTFDMPMGEGMSWTDDAGKYPKQPEGRKAAWSKDGKSCTLPVVLEPGKDYELGLNDAESNNFQSKWGVPLEPAVYKFHTRASVK